MTREKQPDQGGEGVEVPWDRLEPDTLRNMIEEFVTREWAELSDSGYSLDDKVGQVMEQLRARKVKVVFDFRSESANIVVCR